MTPNLSLPLIAASQAQKHVTANEATLGLDALAQLSCIDRNLSAPPGSPSNGDTYIVGSSPTGAWAGEANSVAYYYGGAWYFYPPKEGWIAYVQDQSRFYAFDGAAWVWLSTLL
ncbi:DUF2793 domain-containing protein [Rhodobacteraceae bacterium CCMM004]|nr:DUF2793 domain-containing protein [Rhodobacteraceae bacterium CCMM004]